MNSKVLNQNFSSEQRPPVEFGEVTLALIGWVNSPSWNQDSRAWTPIAAILSASRAPISAILPRLVFSGPPKAWRKNVPRKNVP